MLISNEEYVKSGSKVCPYCKELDNLAFYDRKFTYESGSLFRNVQCCACHKIFQEQYEVVGWRPL